ncbi:uncharacterized protein LOC134505880 [Candoia aspera]|uniref:uncharacterized protein LOC134505880 n=1 Tax=Candoia aspera TaxID=51853 RepID=UPI002FD86316
MVIEVSLTLDSQGSGLGDDLASIHAGDVVAGKREGGKIPSAPPPVPPPRPRQHSACAIRAPGQCAACPPAPPRLHIRLLHKSQTRFGNWFAPNEGDTVSPVAAALEVRRSFAAEPDLQPGLPPPHAAGLFWPGRRSRTPSPPAPTNTAPPD